MKILIVDDEAVSRTKLEAIFEEFGECQAVASGQEAMIAVQKALAEDAPFDLITMDVGMPGMDGTETLYEIRKLEKSAWEFTRSKARIVMITGKKDRDCLITCVQAGCDDYLLKPFDPDVVVQRLMALNLPGVAEKVRARKKEASSERECEETDRVAIGREVLSLFKRGEISLPSPPGIYRQFREMVEREANVSEVAEILKDDLGLSFHLISVSNSPYYRGVEDNRNLQQALGRLGLELTRKYVDLLSNRSVFTISNQAYQPFMESLWEHSVACAHAAELLTKALGLNLEHDPFTLGILHDVGKMVLIQIVSELEAREKIGCDLNRADMLKTLADHHGPFGEAVLKQWNFPQTYCLVARWHDKVDEAPALSPELQVVQISNLIAKSMGYGPDEVSESDILESQSARSLGVDVEILGQVKDGLVSLMEETQKTLK